MSEAETIELLSVHQVNRLVPASETTRWRMVKAGKFPRPIKIAGKNHWRRDEINQWIEAQSASRFVA